MVHPNATLLRSHLDALARGDLPAALSFYSDDVVMHYPGHNPLAGEHRGKPAVIALLKQVMDLTRGRFHPEVHDIMASDEHVAALVTVHAERDDRKAEWQSIDLFHVRNGKLVEHWVHEVDQDAVDRFLS
jgi:hypothetical protein